MRLDIQKLRENLSAAWTAFRAPRVVARSPILEIAAQLDAKSFSVAEQMLRVLPLEGRTLPERRLLLNFWMRIWNNRLSPDAIQQDIAAQWHSGLERAAVDPSGLWQLVRLANEAAPILGASDVALTLATSLWDRLPKLGFSLQYEVVSRLFIGGNSRQMLACYAHIMRLDPSFVPDFWQWQSVVRAWSETEVESSETKGAQLIAETGRSDLEMLIEIYQKIVRQRDVDGAFATAATLTDPVQRERMANYLVDASQTASMIEPAVRLHDQIAPPEAVDERILMQARLAISRGEWAKTLELTHGLLVHPTHRDTAVCLRALALAMEGDFENSRAATDHVRLSDRTPWFLRGRAALIGMTRRMVQDGIGPVDTVSMPALSLGSGRPLAQSLWVGPKLRWIEQMSMKSYLLNGWRYKLFVYDIPEGVPDGVEICDASSILPRSTIFREGEKSGAHKGSLGAFSDLFRYALLAKLGGLWTDTDMVNLAAFESDGRRLVGTEWSDAGIVGPNGAIMAAPANDPVQKLALERAEDILADGALHFARIGPELLAEIFGQNGLQGYLAMPPQVVNPVGWMETGRLLAPFEQTRAMPVLRQARNLHVYTETWRLIGLGLTDAPSGAGFLPVLFDRVMNASGSSPNRVMELMTA